jgi:hypothetical protein
MSDTDPFEEALREVGERSAKLRGIVGAVFVVPGLALSVSAYGQVQSTFFEGGGLRAVGSGPAMVGGVAFLAVLALFVGAGLLAARIAVRVRRKQWLDSIAKKHGVDAKALEESAGIFR